MRINPVGAFVFLERASVSFGRSSAASTVTRLWLTLTYGFCSALGRLGHSSWKTIGCQHLKRVAKPLKISVATFSSSQMPLLPDLVRFSFFQGIGGHECARNDLLMIWQAPKKDSQRKEGGVKGSCHFNARYPASAEPRVAKLMSRRRVHDGLPDGSRVALVTSNSPIFHAQCQSNGFGRICRGDKKNRLYECRSDLLWRKELWSSSLSLSARFVRRKDSRATFWMFPA